MVLSYPETWTAATFTLFFCFPDLWPAVCPVRNKKAQNPRNKPLNLYPIIIFYTFYYMAFLHLRAKVKKNALGYYLYFCSISPISEK
jgi:hypothetical protein